MPNLTGVPLLNWDEIHDLASTLPEPVDAIEYSASSVRRAPYSNVSEGPSPVVRRPLVVEESEPEPIPEPKPVLIASSRLRKSHTKKSPKP